MAQWLMTAVHCINVTSNTAAIPGGGVNANSNSAMVTMGMIKVVSTAKWSCSVWGLSKPIAERQKKKSLKFQANRTYSFWNVAVERFYVFYCFCQYIDKVNENMLISIHFLPKFYLYFMNKPSYYFYLTEFWSKTNHSHTRAFNSPVSQYERPRAVALASSACVDKTTKIITEFTRKDPFLRLKRVN